MNELIVPMRINGTVRYVDISMNESAGHRKRWGREDLPQPKQIICAANPYLTHEEWPGELYIAQVNRTGTFYSEPCIWTTNYYYIVNLKTNKIEIDEREVRLAPEYPFKILSFPKI